MIFSLEVIEAKHGDCLLLHYGSTKNPKTIVIDGGPAGVYSQNLKPRLLELKDKLSPGKPFPLSMIMVSHLDDDHINGILQLMDDIDSDNHYEVNDVWVNTFDDIVGNVQLPTFAAFQASAAAVAESTLPLPANTPHHIAAVIASTPQGRKLRDIAAKLSIRINHPFKKVKKNPPLARGDNSQPKIDWDGVSIKVVHPNTERLLTLQKQWDKDLKKANEKGDETVFFASISDPDTSPFNMSSIVCYLKYKGKTILLTGDGRSEDIYTGLKANKLLDSKGKIHVDILKMPHHGSIRNMEKKFLEMVTADYYVISADGNHDNPDQPLLDIIVNTVKKGTLVLTNREGKKGLNAKIDKFLKALDTSGSKLKVLFLEDRSILIDLLDEYEY